jgi:PleD family two-component response regulator
MTPPSSQVISLRHGESIGDLIAHANEAMHKATKSGRHRVVSFA